MVEEVYPGLYMPPWCIYGGVHTRVYTSLPAYTPALQCGLDEVSSVERDINGARVIP